MPTSLLCSGSCAPVSSPCDTDDPCTASTGCVPSMDTRIAADTLPARRGRAPRGIRRSRLFRAYAGASRAAVRSLVLARDASERGDVALATALEEQGWRYLRQAERIAVRMGGES